MNITRDTAERFWSKVDKTDQCWVWKAHLSQSGYGVFWYKTKNVRAHRFSWRIHFGKIPNDLRVCHHCDNRRCIRPSHLFLGTDKDNLQDAHAKGKNIWGAGENCTSAKLTNKQAIAMRLLFQSGQCSRRDLVNGFHIGIVAVNRILRNATYKMP